MLTIYQYEIKKKKSQLLICIYQKGKKIIKLIKLNQTYISGRPQNIMCETSRKLGIIGVGEGRDQLTLKKKRLEI